MIDVIKGAFLQVFNYNFSLVEILLILVSFLLILIYKKKEVIK